MERRQCWCTKKSCKNYPSSHVKQSFVLKNLNSHCDHTRSEEHRDNQKRYWLNLGELIKGKRRNGRHLCYFHDEVWSMISQLKTVLIIAPCMVYRSTSKGWSKKLRIILLHFRKQTRPCGQILRISDLANKKIAESILRMLWWEDRSFASPFSSPEPLGLICNRPSFPDHVTKKRRALGTRMSRPQSLSILLVMRFFISRVALGARMKLDGQSWSFLNSWQDWVRRD